MNNGASIRSVSWDAEMARNAGRLRCERERLDMLSTLAAMKRASVGAQGEQAEMLSDSIAELEAMIAAVSQ